MKARKELYKPHCFLCFIANIFLVIHNYSAIVKILQSENKYLKGLIDCMKDLDFARIGKRIKEIRRSKDLTQEYLANAADVNTSHISNIENNRVKISLTTLVYVCKALDVTVDYILADEYNEPASVLDECILRELQSCDIETKEKILKIIQIIR